MRQDFDRQLKLDVPQRQELHFDPTSRHELEAILMGLYHLYQAPQTVHRILKLLAKDLNVNTRLGCTAPHVLGSARARRGAFGVQPRL